MKTTDSDNKETNLSKTESIEEEPRIIFKEYKHINQVIFNHPKKLNALCKKMLHPTLDKIIEWYGEYDKKTYRNKSQGEKLNASFRMNKDSNPSLVKKPIMIMKGMGRAFSAGGNLSEVYYIMNENKEIYDLNSIMEKEYLIHEALKNKVPIQISLWHGPVMGFAVGISINSRIKICTSSTKFAMPETKIGYFTDACSSYTMSRVFHKNPEVGMYICLTAEMIQGYDLMKLGLVDYYVDEEKYKNIEDRIAEFIEQEVDFNDVTEKNGVEYNIYIEEIVDKIKDFLASYCDTSYEELEKKNLVNENCGYKHLSIIKYIFQYDSIFNIFKRLGKVINRNEQELPEQVYKDINEEVVCWAKKIKSNLDIRSPRSLIIVFELLKKGRDFKIYEDGVDFEIKLSASYINEPDFLEGIRALLIDKDNNPKWKEKSIYEVDYNSFVSKYIN